MATRLLSGCTIVVILLTPTLAIADPVRGVLSIQVVSVAFGAENSEEFRIPFAASFPLTLTFDDRIVATFGDCCSRVEKYGSNFSISAVPLGSTPLPGHIQFGDNHDIGQGWSRSDDGTFTHDVGFYYDRSFNPQTGQFGPDIEAALVVSSKSGLTSKPALNAQALPSLIRPPADGAFNFFYFYQVGSDSPRATYFGYASSADGLTPVPEPTGLLLVATGLALAVVRRRMA